MTEEQALRLLRERDPEGLTWFIRRYTPYVSAVVWNIVGRCMTRQDAEELCSDVFLALWQNGDRPRPGKVKSYLGAIARNKAFNRLRSMGLEMGDEDDLLTVPVDGPETTVEARELARLVRAGVDGLGPPDTEIFVRFYYYCQPTADIARAMGLSSATVRQRLKRGRDKLRQYFTNGGMTDEISDVL